MADHLVGWCALKFHGMFTISARSKGELGGGGVVIPRVYREEARDKKVSSVVASSCSTASLGRQFQSLMVLGKNEAHLYCVVAVMSLNCLSWPQCWQGGWGAALLGVGGWGNGLGRCGFCTAWRAWRSDGIFPVWASPMLPASCWHRRCFYIC